MPWNAKLIKSKRVLAYIVYSIIKYAEILNKPSCIPTWYSKHVPNSVVQVDRKYIFTIGKKSYAQQIWHDSHDIVIFQLWLETSYIRRTSYNKNIQYYMNAYQLNSLLLRVEINKIHPLRIIIIVNTVRISYTLINKPYNYIIMTTLASSQNINIHKI